MSLIPTGINSGKLPVLFTSVALFCWYLRQIVILFAGDE